MTAIFATMYGPSKVGKSTCTGAAGAAGLFIAQGGGLLPLKNFLGLDGLKVKSAQDVAAASKIVEAEAGKHPTIVIDDFSILVEQTIALLEKKHSFGEMWRALRAQVLGMRDAARVATEKGTHVIFNCHESPPKTSSGKYVRGGPALPGQLPEQFSAFSDVVARVVYDETAAPWKFVLNTISDPQYIGGDRLAIFPPSSPMNLAEALRAAGYDLPRPKGMEWMEKAVASLSKSVLDDGIENWKTTLKPAAEKLCEKYAKPHVRWALQDSLHRAIIVNAKSSVVEDFFNSDEQW
tara:strand:- start:2036 stop:2914 length:879 start_codon:yes stop_codon:yes gene_type:complete